MNKSEICDAIRGVKTAKEKLGLIVASNFPVGSDIDWERGGHRQYGTVVDHNGRGRVRVQNSATGARYWIGMFDVIGYVT